MIGRNSVLNTFLLSFMGNIREKLHSTSSMNITMLLMGHRSLCFAYGGFVSVTLRIRGLSYTKEFSKFHRYEIINNA